MLKNITVEKIVLQQSGQACCGKECFTEKAMERTGKDYGDLYTVLKGTTALMLSEMATHRQN